MPQPDVSRNWLPSLGLVLALHAAVWWGMTHFKDDATRPAPLPVVNVTLLPPPEPPQPRVTPLPPEPPKPRQPSHAVPQPQPTPQPVQRPAEVAAAPVVTEEAKPAPPPVPVAAPAPAPPSAPPAPEPQLEPPRYNAAYLSNPPPDYPLAARRRSIEGTVLVRAEISVGGDCLRAELRKSSGAEALDRAALEAVKKWRFVPAKRGSQAVVAWVEVPITFKLDN